MLDAERQREWLPESLRRPAPARIDASIVTVQVDRATAAERISLRDDRHRQHLCGLAIAGVCGNANVLRGIDVVLDAQAELALAHAFSRVEPQGASAGGAPIAAEFRNRQALRIVGLQVEAVGQQRVSGRGRQAAAQQGLATVAP